MSSSTLTDLQIVSSTVKLSDKETRRKYDFAKDMGSIKCPTGRVMFLGDRGVGKTCTKRLLLGKEHIPTHVSTLGIRTHVTETHSVNEDWKELTRDSLKEYDHSELKRALAYFCAFVDNHKFIKSMREKFFDKVINIFRFFFALLSCSFLCYGLTFDGSQGFHFFPILICCFIGVAMSTNDIVIGFNIGNGLAIVVVFVLFWTSQTGGLLQAWLPSMATRLIVLALVGAGAGWFIGFLLALGIGAGLSIALCLMHHPPSVGHVIFSGGEAPARSASLAFLVFFTSCFLGLFSQSLTLQRLSRWVSNFIAPLVFVLSVLFAKTLTSGLTLTHFYLSGFLFGTMFVVGQNHGRAAAWKLNIGHDNRILTDLLGGLIGVFYGHYLGWSWPTIDWWLVLGVMGTLLCLACELHRYAVKRREVVPVGLIRKMTNEGHKDWPTKLHLLDCAGNSIYHNTHHIFMSRHSIYLVLFRLDQLKTRPEECQERILYWINSVFAHAAHRDSKVFLVATHKMNVPDADERHTLLSNFSLRMKSSFAGRLAKNRSKNYYVFSLDNCQREFNDEDVQLLKEDVWNSAMGAEYTSLPNRVTWFAFLDVVRAVKSPETSDEERNCGLIQSCQALWEKVRDRCHLKKETDFYRMLRYFNDCGEIYYDSRDPVLCRYVVLDPQLLVDCVSDLLQCEAVVEDLPEHLENDQETLKKKGVITFRLLSHYLRKFQIDHRKLVQLLKSLDILIPLTLTKGLLFEESDRYVVTFMLPLRQTNDPTFQDADRIVIFDFDYFYPEPVFLRLLAKCHQLSFTTTEQHDFIVCEENIYMCKDEGIFYFGNGIHYSMKLHRPDTKTNQIWIRIKGLNDDLYPDIYDFMQQMDALMLRICRRFFEFLEYKYLMVCDCSMGDVEDGGMGVGQKIDTLILVDHSHNAQNNLKNFPDRARTYLCKRNSRTVRFNANPKCDETEMIREPNLSIIDLPESRVDAFISCCPQDRLFVQTDIVPFLENAVSKSFGNSAGDSISVLINYYDNPNPNGNFWTAQAINKHLIRQCHCVIVICSVNYGKSTERKDIESAIIQNIPVIPVFIDDAEQLDCLRDVRGITYPREPELLTESFYVPLIRSVRNFCNINLATEPNQPGPLRKIINWWTHDQRGRREEEPVIL